jgi:hypothetical protein
MNQAIAKGGQVLKAVPPIVWLVGGVAVVVLVFGSEIFNNLIGPGGTKIKETVDNITGAAISATDQIAGAASTATVSTVDAGINGVVGIWDGLETFVGVGGSGIPRPSDN